VPQRIKPLPQVVPERVFDFAITPKLVETPHSSLNNISRGTDAMGSIAMTDSHRRVSISGNKFA
jgi:hypothetical protein